MEPGPAAGGRRVIVRRERLGRYVLLQSEAAFPLGSDTLALGRFATVRRGWRVCDLGCGSGALGLLLLEREEKLSLTGVELDPAAAALARETFARNGLDVPVRTGDLRDRGLLPAAGRLVRNGGRFALVHRPERLPALFSALEGNGFAPKRMALVQHRVDKPPSAVLVEAVRQGRPGLEVLPTVLLEQLPQARPGP